ncbi:MAG: hypothetical protein AB8W37_11920 [Arsenophonus endosymbiont of Dermacentor nuttalli]
MRCVYTVEDAALKLVVINGDQRLLTMLDEIKQVADSTVEDNNTELLLSERTKIPFLEVDAQYELVSSTALVVSKWLKQSIYLVILTDKKSIIG